MILVVTSLPAVADELRHLITSGGYAVNTNDCGDNIPAIVRFTRPAMVVIDCDLTDSFDLVRSLRADASAKAVPLVMFANAGVPMENQALAAGADAYVAKGELDWADLLDQIRRFAGSPKPEDQAEQQ